MALTIPVADIVENSKNPLLGRHESWGRVLLGDIATIQNGFPFKSSQFTRDEGMPLIRIRDVGADKSETYYIGDYDPAYEVQAGDLLIGMDGDFNCARWRGPKGLLNQRVCRVILNSDVYHPRLLDYALPGYLKAINDMTSSVTVKHLSSKSIAEIPLPLPPMDQQKQIVAEIEKQFSRLDEAMANLKRVKANLRRYKAAVLKAAVEGRLVETEASIARREGRSYETGEQFLQRILETRRSQWKGKGKYKEPAKPDTTDLSELPEGWAWASAEQICGSVRDGTHDTPGYVDSGVPLVTSKNLTDNGIDFENVKLISDKDHAEISRRSGVEIGDVLFAMIGTIGNPCEIKTDSQFSIKNVGLFKRYPEYLNSAYLCLCLDSPPLRKWLEPRLKGTTQKFAPLGLLREIPVPYTSLFEQGRIVAEVDRRISLVRELETQVETNLKRADRARQSILNAAFSGYLVESKKDEIRAAV